MSTEKQPEKFPFFQDNTGERVAGWLAMSTGKLIPNDDREFCKIATPEDVKNYIEKIKKKAIAAIESIETCCQSQGDKTCGCAIEKAKAIKKIKSL